MITNAQRTAIQTWLRDAWDKIQARQDQYAALRGTFRQYKGSHKIPPSAGTPKAPDNLNDAPTNENDGDTLRYAAAAAGWPCQIIVNVYESPLGPGYEAVARVRGSGGEVWRICRQIGPETWREHTWQQETTA